MNIQPVNAITIEKAAGLLRSRKLVAFPTETVYGLGGDATSDLAVAEIFSVKGRPSFNPLIVHVSSADMAKRYVSWNASAEKLAGLFWPGPLTLILPRLPDSKISLLACAGGDTVGVRLPANATAQALLKEADIPVAAPSANRSGRVSPTSAQHVYEELGESIPLILDGGSSALGIESSVIDISGERPVLYRPGFITCEQLESALGRKIAVLDDQSGIIKKSPGLLASHYAPTLPVRLNVLSPQRDEALLAFGREFPRTAAFTLNLSAIGDMKEAAARLFASLRTLDNPDRFSAIAVMPIPNEGIGIAINDRLKRAAVK